MAQAAGGHPGQASGSGLLRPPISSGSHNLEVSAMEDDQLYSMILGMDPPPPISVPAGMEERPSPVSLDDAKKAIQSAKAAIGAKSLSKSDQTDGGSNSEDEDFSPKGRMGKNKRVMANRQSAQRSRLRKLQYIQDLENNVNRLQNEICQIQPQLNFLREKYTGLLEQNRSLRDRVAQLLNEARHKNSVNNSLKEKIARLVAQNQQGDSSALGMSQDTHNAFPQPAAPHYNSAV